MPSEEILLEQRPFDVLGAQHETRELAAGALGDFLEPLRIRRIRRADDDQRIDDRRDALHRLLPVGRRVADVLAMRPDDAGKCRVSASTMERVSSTESVVCVT